MFSNLVKGPSQVEKGLGVSYGITILQKPKDTALDNYAGSYISVHCLFLHENITAAGFQLVELFARRIL